MPQFALEPNIIDSFDEKIGEAIKRALNDQRAIQLNNSAGVSIEVYEGERMVRDRKVFIEGTIGNHMSYKKDFESIKYVSDPESGHEYVRFNDIYGMCICLDITGKSFEQILEDASRIVLLGKDKVTPPEGLVEDREKLKEIAPLFK